MTSEISADQLLSVRNWSIAEQNSAICATRQLVLSLPGIAAARALLRASDNHCRIKIQTEVGMGMRRSHAPSRLQRIVRFGTWEAEAATDAACSTRCVRQSTCQTICLRRRSVPSRTCQNISFRESKIVDVKAAGCSYDQRARTRS